MGEDPKNALTQDVRIPEWWSKSGIPEE